MLHPENLCFVLLSSFVYSLIEIELEADQGWMKKIPTAKAINLGGKELTLYHVYMIIMKVQIQEEWELYLHQDYYQSHNLKK